jgi:hypothetical protein
MNMGLRYEYATPQYERDNQTFQLRSANELAHPGEEWLDLRSGAGPSRPEQLGAAIRLRL